jgi:nitrogenase molybdenum-iron protein NifN
MDPLKLSAPLGGALAFLGLSGSIPLLHGSQGCSAFAKALLTRHFQEPIPMQTSAVTEITAVLGPAQNLHAALDTITEKLAPDVIGVLTTGLVEAAGEDLDGAMDAYRTRRSCLVDPSVIVAVSTPDFVGGLSEGWAAALAALVTEAVSGTGRRWAAAAAEPVPDGPTLPVLTGVSQTAGDLDEIAWLVGGFGLRPVLIPDLSGSLDGHLADGWAPLTTGGTTLADLARLPDAPVVHAVAATAGPAAAALPPLTGAEVVTRAHLAGLEAVDGFVADLMRLTGSAPGQDVRRWRARFTDTLLDTHIVLSGARVAIAAEPEHLAAIATLLATVGAEVVAAVAPTPHAVLADVPCPEIVVGDLEDLRARARAGGAQLLIGSSHVGRIAAELDSAYLACGLPVHDRVGAALRATAGYRGGTRFLAEAANRLTEHHAHHAHRRHRTGAAGPAERARRVTSDHPIDA